MNNFKKFLYGATALLLATGCSDDIMNSGQDSNGGLDKDGPGVYIGVNFQLPGMGSTRSYTDGDNQSSGGIEVGSDIENNVNEVLLILARPDNYGFIGAATVLKNNIALQSSATDKIYHATAKFSTTDLSQYYKDNTLTQKGKVAVFVVANPVGAVADALRNAQYGSTEWINTPKQVLVDANGMTEGSIWSSTNGGSFLMTNSAIAIRQIPAQESAWVNHTTEDRCFNLSAENGTPGSENYIDNSAEEGGNGGSVKVERAAARMDFRDGSEHGNNTYHVVDMQMNGTSYPLIDIVLNRMCLVNMNNQFYCFPRVSSNGLPAGAQICGPEKPWYINADGTYGTVDGNYVVDFYATQKEAGIQTNFSNYFNYTFFDNDGTFNTENVNLSNNNWYVSNISDVLSDGTPDNWEGSSNGGTVAKGTYKVWRYLTENTIPGIDAQKNGVTTGVVFKGKMRAHAEALADLDAALTENPNDSNAYWAKLLINTINNNENKLGNSDLDPKLYSYAGDLYVTWQNIKSAAINTSFSYSIDAEGNLIVDWNRTNSLYKALFGAGGTGHHIEFTLNGTKYEYTDDLPLASGCANTAYNTWYANPNSSAALQAFRSAVTSVGITIYESSQDAQEGWGYYCYYYYWNRHNDNGKNGIMGPMEFAVVRNNVYKLAVTKIAKLGHPRISSNDPEPPTPDTDDETGNIYLTVDAEVVPWVVRVNDIVFE